MIENLQGVITPLITPFKKDFSIDYESLDFLLEFLLKEKVNGFFVNATTGEFTSLSHQEKKDYAKFVINKTKGKAVNLLNVSSTVFSEVQDLIRFAKENKFEGIVSPPPYFLIPDRNSLINYFKLISEESGLPTFIYNIPSATGYSVPQDVVFELIEKCPNVSGIKATFDNMDYLRGIILYGKKKRKFTVMTGIETYFIPTLISGGDGGILGLSNFAPNIFVNSYNAFKEKNLDALTTFQRKIMRLFEVYKLSNSFGGAVKIALNLLGFKIELVTRNPLQLDVSHKEEIQGIIKEIYKEG